LTKFPAHLNFQLDTNTGEGRQIKLLTDNTGSWQQYFDPKIQPKDITPHQAAIWSINQMLTPFNSILNLMVHDGVAYLGTGSGKLYAVPL